MSDITSHKQVIDLWPNQATFAREIGHEYHKINKWYIRNMIPPQYWVAVVNAAHEHDFPITYKSLAEMIMKQPDIKKPLSIAG